MARVIKEIAEDAFLELEFLKQALDEHAIVSIADIKGNITYINKKFCEISGYSHEELLGQNHRILKSNKHSEEFIKDMWRTIANGKPWHGEIKNHKKDGGYYWVEATIVPFLDKQGKPNKYISIRTDITARKDAEKEKSVNAAQEIRQFEATLDFSEDIIHMFWPDTLRCFYANKAALAVAGYSDKPHHDMTPFDINPNLYEGEFHGRLESLIHGKKKTTIYQAMRPNCVGKQIPYEINLQYIEPVGEKPRFVIIARNISKQKLLEQEMREFRTTLDFSNDAIHMFWPGTLEYFYVNQTALDISDLREEEIIGSTLAQLNPNFDEDAFRKRSTPLVLGKEKSTIYELNYVNRNGKQFSLEVFLQFITPENGKPRFVSIARDITKRLEAEREILQFKATLDLTENEVYMFWPDTLKFFYVNQAAKKKLGWSYEEFLSMTPLDIKPKFGESEFRNVLLPLTLGKQRSVTFETVHQTHDGEIVPVEINLQYLKPIGEKPRFVAIVMDITERQKVDKAKSEFISTVSHELRTPLTSIKGVLGLIKAGLLDDSPDELHSMISIAHSNSERLTVLVNDLLDIGKIDAGAADLQRTVTNINWLVEDAIKANEGYAVEYGATHVCFHKNLSLMANVNKDRLMQVMANLLSNAVKFSSRGGEVEVSVSRQGKNIRVAVKDCGCGIPEEARATIFDRFTQADSSDQRAKGGTGLGLSIAKAIVEGHGGTIGFTTETGKGTTFYFDLKALTIENAAL